MPFHARRLRDGGLPMPPCASAALWQAWRRLPVLPASFGEAFRYTLSVMDTIPRTAAGKLRPFVCAAA